MSCILGVDPGFGGALAFLHSFGKLEVHDMPVVEIERNGKRKRTIDAAAVAAMIRAHRPTHAVVERVGAMPGQGVASTFAFGRGVGQIEGVITALAVPMDYVAPRVWQAALRVPKGKDGSRLRASELLPAYAGEWRRKRDDGRAEAALIALYALLHLPAIERQCA